MSGLVRSENIADLVDKAAAVCADMYNIFLHLSPHYIQEQNRVFDIV